MQRVKSSQEHRLKDLPNLSMRLELLLRRAGIHSVEMLKNYGAKTCWLKMRASNKNLGINILFALEGAITGRHCSVLPAKVKTELVEWHRSATGSVESASS
ncbi:MAG: Protein Sxy [Candidatus Erwinia impunctatus]|nr:Protein Sxy [Culicoides impunctatus]